MMKVYRNEYSGEGVLTVSNFSRRSKVQFDEARAKRFLCTIFALMIDIAGYCNLINFKRDQVFSFFKILRDWEKRGSSYTITHWYVLGYRWMKSECACLNNTEISESRLRGGGITFLFYRTTLFLMRGFFFNVLWLWERTGNYAALTKEWMCMPERYKN